jgi:ribosomal protein S18 acetylase RimI-like enzyme
MPPSEIALPPLAEFPADAFLRIGYGYTSPARWTVRREAAPEAITITTTLEPLVAPYVKRWPYSDEDLRHYAALVAEEGLSWGAYAGETLVGIALGEARAWNRTLWVWELHVAEAFRGRGIGRALVERLAGAGRERGLRVMVCETQNTNAPAIAFYRRVGFELDGIDLSYYSNEDVTQGEVAFFMKRSLT